MQRATASAMIVMLLGCFPRPPTALGQYYQVPSWEPESHNGPRERRASRERAVRLAGSAARGVVEAYGEDAVAAIFACSRKGRQTLVEFHASGGLGRMPRPGDLLRAVARPKHGDDVIVWAAEHEAELIDADCFAAFVTAPLEYALGLKRLADGAEELRASRAPYQQPSAPNSSGFSDPRDISRIAGILAVVGLLVWWVRRRRRM